MQCVCFGSTSKRRLTSIACLVYRLCYREHSCETVRAVYVRRVQTWRHRSSSSDSLISLQDSSRTLVNCQDIKSCQHRSRSESASLSKREKGKIGPFRLTTHEIIGAQSGKQPAAAFLLFSCPRSRSPDYYPCLWCPCIRPPSVEKIAAASSCPRSRIVPAQSISRRLRPLSLVEWWCWHRLES